MPSEQGDAGPRRSEASAPVHPTLDSIRKSLDALQADRTASSGDDFALRDDVQRLDLELQKVQADQTRAETEQIRQTQKLREKYAERVYRLLKGWVCVAITLLVLDALNPPAFFKKITWIDQLIPAFDIERQVMLGLLGGTTVAVVGLVLAVVKGLFPGSSKD